MSRSYVSAERAIVTIRSDINVEEDLHEARPTTSMKTVWICRNSCDKKNQEIALVMMTSDDLAVMIQIQSNDVDPDREMIQIQ